MIIRRAFYREAALTILAILAVLVVVVIFFGMSSLLGRAARGQYADRVVLALLAWETVKKLDLLLPLSLYLGVLITFARWYRDSEMAVLAACGVGLNQLLKPVLVLALVTATAVASLGFYVTPLASRSIEQIKKEGARRPEISGILPGRFTETDEGRRIIYVESINPKDGRLEGVFVVNRADADSGVLFARAGMQEVETKSGDKFLILRDGAVYRGTPGRADYSIMEFAHYRVRVREHQPQATPVRVEGMPTASLLAERSDYNTAEWHWRLSKPAVVMILAVFALLLAHTDARRGRMANFFAAIVVYFVYSNLLTMGLTLIKKAKVPGWFGMWWVHLLFALLAFYFLWRRTYNRPLIPLPVWVRR